MIGEMAGDLLQFIFVLVFTSSCGMYALRPITELNALGTCHWITLSCKEFLAISLLLRLTSTESKNFDPEWLRNEKKDSCRFLFYLALDSSQQIFFGFLGGKDCAQFFGLTERKTWKVCGRNFIWRTSRKNKQKH